MNSSLGENAKSEAGSRYRAFATMLFLAVIVVLWVLSGLLENQRLRLSHFTLQSFLTSHLLHFNNLHYALTLLLILITGSILETRWGTPRYVFFYLFVAWGTALATILSQLIFGEPAPSNGAAGVVLGSFAAIGLLYPDHKLIRHLPPMKHLAWMLIFLGGGGLALLDRMSPDPEKQTFLLPQISGVPCALVFLWLDPLCQRFLERWKAMREEERRERVVAIRHRVDQLLEKIHAHGYESLTRDEKLFLRQASKHYKN
jgi:membrane associated rhomboid family serine protease